MPKTNKKMDKDSKKDGYSKNLVGPLRFERRTSRLSAVRSARLSYGPQMAGFLELSKLKAFSGKHPNPTTLLILNLLLIAFA
jgi:hypothetical protein